MAEVWYDCIDQNCDGNDGDRDNDGYVDAGYAATCADWATINPGKQDGDCWDNIAIGRPSYAAINGFPKARTSLTYTPAPRTSPTML
ncbi:MAG: hypothetical protein IPO67_31335 [Deltaproteobacteria bacterium]|nr:hypothetical protein [Deltaproteobacteria bacterium]